MYQKFFGLIVIGVVVALISGAITNWGYQRGFEKGRRRQHAETERFLQLASGDPGKRLLLPPPDIK